MSFAARDFAGSHCGCRYQQDYRPTLGRDGKKESGTLEVIKFYYDGAIRFEQHCYGCLLYTSDAADEEESGELGGRRSIKKKKREREREREGENREQ